LLAPLALIACALAVILVVSSSRSDGGGSDDSTTSAEQRTTTTATTPRKQRASYTVKTGDTLGAIAEKTGLTVERLQELNPELDPQALVSGQKIKLRE
jgi:teichoic acid transport system ATP-binding protein